MADESVKRLSVTRQWSRESDLITVILFLSGHGPEFLYSLPDWRDGRVAEERSCVPSSSRDNQAGVIRVSIPGQAGIGDIFLHHFRRWSDV